MKVTAKDQHVTERINSLELLDRDSSETKVLSDITSDYLVSGDIMKESGTESEALSAEETKQEEESKETPNEAKSELKNVGGRRYKVFRSLLNF